MSKSYLSALPLAAAMLFASYSLPTWAQGSAVATGSRADPADAAARVLPVVYQSSFAVYKGFSDQEVKDWRESNDNVGRIGGWRAYAQEARPSKPAAKNAAEAAAPGSTTPKPAPATKPASAAKSPLVPPVRNPSGPSTAPAASGGASDAHQHH